MDWDYENWRTTDVLSFETKATCEKNMEAIKEMAKLMTPEQLSDFIHGDYTNKEETA